MDNTKIKPGRYAAALKADERGNVHAARAVLVNMDFDSFDNPDAARRVADESLSTSEDWKPMPIWRGDDFCMDCGAVIRAGRRGCPACGSSC